MPHGASAGTARCRRRVRLRAATPPLPQNRNAPAPTWPLSLALSWGPIGRSGDVVNPDFLTYAQLQTNGWVSRPITGQAQPQPPRRRRRPATQPAPPEMGWILSPFRSREMQTQTLGVGSLGCRFLVPLLPRGNAPIRLLQHFVALFRDQHHAAQEQDAQEAPG